MWWYIIFHLSLFFLISSGNHLLIIRSKILLNLSRVLVQVPIISFVNWLYFILLDQNYVFYNSRQTKPDQCNGLWAMETKDDERWGGGWQTLSHYRKPCTLHVFQLQGAVVSDWRPALLTFYRTMHVTLCKVSSSKSTLQTCGSSYRQPALPRYSVQFLSLSKLGSSQHHQTLAVFSSQKVPKLFGHIKFFNTCMKY